MNKEVKSIPRLLAAIGAILLVIMAAATACRPAGAILNEDGAIECGADGQPIKLVNNAAAADPTYAELMEFIKADPTDRKAYVKSGPQAYVCADFAEEVHNNAEAYGIRAAWVAITFAETDEGHAINAFETTDRGLVYIDCTNGSGDDGTEDTTGWDTVAYLETGKRMGLIPLDQAKSLRYDYYEQYTQKWQEHDKLLDAYNEEVDRFNREIKGKVYIIGSVEEATITAWEKELDAQKEALDSLEEEIGTLWYESDYAEDTVKSVTVHW